MQITIQTSSKSVKELLQTAGKYELAIANKDRSALFTGYVKVPKTAANSIYADVGQAAVVDGTVSDEIEAGERFNFQDSDLDDIRFIASAATNVVIMMN